MTDDKERVDWSALMDAHGIEPDADTASPAVEPASRVVEGGRAGRGRLVHVLVAVTALFSIAASAAVLIVILRGGGDDQGAARAAADEPMVPLGPRPAAFEQTTDGVIVVPPGPEPAPPAPAAAPPAPEPARPAPAVKKSRPAKSPAAPAAKEEPAVPTPAPPPDPNLPDEPDGAAVAAAMAGLEKDIAACAQPAQVSGEVGIKMRIEPDGKVAWAAAKVQSSPFQSCLDRLFKKARMPRSAKGATVRQTVQLP